MGVSGATGSNAKRLATGAALAAVAIPVPVPVVPVFSKSDGPSPALRSSAVADVVLAMAGGLAVGGVTRRLAFIVTSVSPLPNACGVVALAGRGTFGNAAPGDADGRTDRAATACDEAEEGPAAIRVNDGSTFARVMGVVAGVVGTAFSNAICTCGRAVSSATSEGQRRNPRPTAITSNNPSNKLLRDPADGSPSFWDC